MGKQAVHLTLPITLRHQLKLHLLWSPERFLVHCAPRFFDLPEEVVVLLHEFSLVTGVLGLTEVNALCFHDENLLETIGLVTLHREDEVRVESPLAPPDE